MPYVFVQFTTRDSYNRKGGRISIRVDRISHVVEVQYTEANHADIVLITNHAQEANHVRLFESYDQVIKAMSELPWPDRRR